MTKLIPVAAPNDITIANIYKMNLETEGIKCIMENESIAVAHPFLANAVGGIIIKVQEKDIKRAKEIINEINI